jgi:FkbM family methyltransferase
MQGTLKQALGRVQNILKRKPKRWKVIIGNEELIAQKYAGYSVLYVEGNPLMDRIKYAGELYEHETIGALCDELKLRKAWTFLDVGANIGLISLPLLRRFPDLRIEAFEPGPHQSNLLEETIKYNNLASRLFIHKTALADYKGETDFYIHSYGDILNGGSGDGFIDTGRAGSTKRISVSVERLDDWWIRAGSPDVGVVKIDTEGAELLILKGARLFLETCRPSLFLEIWPENLKNYPYCADDIFDFLTANKYQLFTLEGEIINDRQSEELWKKSEGNYLAKPI